MSHCEFTTATGECHTFPEAAREYVSQVATCRGQAGAPRAWEQERDGSEWAAAGWCPIINARNEGPPGHAVSAAVDHRAASR
jgi:hypothetical protein